MSPVSRPPQRHFRAFVRGEKGAVSVDWIVLTAAVVGLSAIHFFMLENAATDLVEGAAGAVSSQNDF